MKESVKIISIAHVTHDVLHIVAEKPAGLTYQPGQAADISINKPGWEEELRPFTFTSLPGDAPIEFIIKTYPSHKGVTAQLLDMEPGNALILHGVFGDIAYKGEGIFIAGGAGVTPFIAILKDLEHKGEISNNKLIFANKTKGDIILEDKLHDWLGDNLINVLSDEALAGYEHGYISKELIQKNMDTNTKYFYLCGPDPMMQAVEAQLSALGVPGEQIIKEGF